MRRMTLGLAAAAVIAGSVGFGGAARATTLLVNNALTNGSLTFTVSSCTYQVDGTTAANCGALQMLSSGNGVQITATSGSIFSDTSSSYRSTDDLQLDLTVTSSAGAILTGASVAIAGSGDQASAIMGGSETVYDASANPLGSVMNVNLGAPNASTNFAAQATLGLVKDFGIFQTPTNGVTDTLSSITETFTTTAAVPEPTSIALLATSICLVFGVSRRRAT